MPKFVDRTGLRYGRLVALSVYGRSGNGKILWLCACDCGAQLPVSSCSLQTGNTTSCGCYLKEKITKHGGSGKGSYNSWRAMIRRCTKPEDKDYPRYGGAGVFVAAEWLDYARFKSDMGEPPTDAHSLDRIDPYGGYTKSNCRWATATEQNRNVRNRERSRGVSLRGNLWYAIIGVNNRQVYSKGFPTKAEAVAERKRQEENLWGVK